jgi:hypothetical protein
MRLTNNIRDAFVRAVMQDVPKIDFDEQARKLVLDDSAGQLPPKIKALVRSAETAPFVRTADYWTNMTDLGIYRAYAATGDTYKPRAETLLKLKELNDAKRAQEATRSALRARLKSVALGASTRKALADALPEFEKYLPADEPAAVRSLPVVANVVADFVKAGWPKGKQPARVAAAA